MRTIERTTAFKRDFRHEAKGAHRDILDSDLRQIIIMLANDMPLDAKYRDHSLTNARKDYRDCRVKPDLVLIYRRIGADRRILARCDLMRSLIFDVTGKPPVENIETGEAN